jgi:hypothetical protein
MLSIIEVSRQICLSLGLASGNDASCCSRSSNNSSPPHYVDGKPSWVVWLLGKLMPLSVMDGLYAMVSGPQKLAASQ